MDIKDLEPILILMAEQEERYIGKFKELTILVKETKDEAVKHNGRMRKLELVTHDLERDAESRSKSCSARFTEISPTIKTVKFINNVMNHPKKILLLVLAGMVFTQGFVVYAIEHQWIRDIVNFLK